MAGSSTVVRPWGTQSTCARPRCDGREVRVVRLPRRGREQDPVARRIGLQSVIEKSLLHFLTTNLHTGFGHDATGFVQNVSNQCVRKDV